MIAFLNLPPDLRHFACSMVMLMCTLTFTNNSLASTNEPITSLLIELDGVARTLLLEPRNLDHYQLEFAADSQFYSARLSDDPAVTGRISFIAGQWQGLLLNRGRLQFLDTTVSTEGNSPRLLAKYLQQDSIAGHCNHASHFSAPSAAMATQTFSPASLNLQSLQIPAGTFDNYCDSAMRVDGVCLLAELSMVFDAEFQSTFGSDYAAQAAAIMENVDFIYQTEFGIRFKRLHIEFDRNNVFDGSSTIPSNLADQIQSPIEELLWDMLVKRLSGATQDFDSNRQAILHLVTGRNFITATSSAIGIANFPNYYDSSDNPTYPDPSLPVLCSSTADAVGLSQVVDDSSTGVTLTSIVVAHEIGHNFGFDHDGEIGSFAQSCAPTSNQSFIMEPNLNPAATTFSPCSHSAIGPNVEAIAAIENCFDFPYQAAMSHADTNPTDAAAGTTITTNYDISIASRGDQSLTIQVAGTITSSAATLAAATLDGGTSCTLNSARTRYSCVFNPSSSLSTHSLNLELVTGLSELTLQHEVTTTSSSFHDLDPSDNEVNEAISVYGAEELSSNSNITTSASSGGSGGGLGWSLLALLHLLLNRRKSPA